MGKVKTRESYQYHALYDFKVLAYEQERWKEIGKEVNRARRVGITLEVISDFTGISREKLAKVSKEQGYEPNKYHTLEELRAMYLQNTLYCGCMKWDNLHENFDHKGFPVIVKSRYPEFRDRVITRLEKKGYA